MVRLRVTRKGYTRKGYTRRDGTRVGPARIGRSTFTVKDRGKRGRTPASEQWYHPTTHMGWKADQSPVTRRRLALKAHGGDKLATGRALQALANVQSRQNPSVARIAKSDANYFFAKLK